MSHEYRGYTITENKCLSNSGTGFGWRYVHNDYDGPEDKRIGHDDSLGGCLMQIDDAIADELYCDTCDSTGIIQDAEGFKDDCPKCQKARTRIGEAKDYPDNCLLCKSQMSELYPGSGKENMRCERCDKDEDKRCAMVLLRKQEREEWKASQE